MRCQRAIFVELPKISEGSASQAASAHLKIKSAKLIRPVFFIEIVESKMIENIILVQQIIGYLWLFSVYPPYP
jgi:hypothetical protein